MSKTKADPFYTALVGARLSVLYQEGKTKGLWKSHTDFGEQLDPTVTRETVYKWLKGKYNPPSPDHLEQICNLCGVDDDYFSIETATHGEKYRLGSYFIDEVLMKNITDAKDFGLHLDLISALTKVVDFDESFPMYATISRLQGNSLQGYRFIRADNPDSAPADKSPDYLQVEQDGKRKTFHVADLAFLKEVQDQVVDYVNYLFYRRKQEMKREVDRLNEDLVKADFTGPFIPEQFILEHDRFAHLFKDVRLPNPNFDLENASQEDIDRLFDKGIVQEISQEDWDKLMNGETVTTKKEGK